MRRLVATIVVVALSGTAAATAAQAASQASTRGASASAACAKRPATTKKTQAKSRARSMRRVPIARLYAGRLARTRRTCAARHPGSASQSAASRTGAPTAATVPATSAATADPIAVDTPPATVPIATTTPPAASTLGVEARDLGSFVLRLTRTSVAAGQLTIYFRNLDIAEHNLWLSSPDADPGAQRISEDVGYLGGATKTVSVTPGEWRLFCSLPGHSSMERTLTVN